MISIKKKAMSILLCLVMAVSVITALPAKAAPVYEENVTLVMYEKNQIASIYVDELLASEEIKASDVSSSKSSVASIYSITREEQESETEVVEDDEETDDTKNYSYAIDLKLKKKGTTVISFKVGDQTYSTTVKVVKYKNPVKTLKITGVKSGKNIASKTKTKNYVNFKGVNKSSSKLTIKPASGWTVEKITFSCSNTGETKTWKNTVKKSGSKSKIVVSSASLGKLKKANTYLIDITFVNKSGVRETLNYCISKSLKIQGVY